MENKWDIKKEYWQKVIQDQSHSGLSIAEFCRVNHHKLHVFQYYRNRFNKKAAIGTVKKEVKALSPKAFIPVHMEEDAPLSRSLPDPKWLALFAVHLIRGLL